MTEWNVQTLKVHFDALREADSKAISAALASAEKAVGVAETNAEKWRAAANEWRGAMTDREQTFATKAELAALKERADIGQGRGLGLSQGWSLLLGAVGLLSVIISIFLALK